MDDNLPIVGKPYEPLTWIPVSVIKCNCKPNEVTIILITGWQNTVLCPKCNTGYFNEGMKQGPAGIQVSVSVVLPTPKDKVM